MTPKQKRQKPLALGKDDRTTGDPSLDATILKFIYDERTLPCDVIQTTADRYSFAYWVNGGNDGVLTSDDERLMARRERNRERRRSEKWRGNG